MRHRFLTALAGLAALGLAACDDEPGTAELPPDAAADMAADTGSEPDAAPDADAAPETEPRACVLPDIERSAGLVETTRGLVQGRQDDDIWVWQGIPYAAPPVGDLRFRPPEPHACWDTVLDADAYGPACPQLEFGAGGNISAVGDEDCLTLNVWSPVGAADAAARPVLFFIHGGANIAGSAREAIAPDAPAPIYDGAPLAARGDAVIVTVQYRLGALGFLSLPELDAEGETGTSGNQAMLDQVAALRWVRDNIAAFGGDPDRVMVFGESAGGTNTCMMIATPLSDGLMHSALIQSGSCGAIPKAAAQQDGTAVAELVECAGGDRLACLRAIDAATLVERTTSNEGIDEGATDDGVNWGPIVDGYVLPAAPFDRFAAGEHTSIPIVVGSNADEMASRALNRLTIETPEDYDRAVRSIFGILGMAAVDRIFETYPVDGFESPDDAFIQVTTDAFFTCSARKIARILAAGQADPVYRYFFARRFESPMGEGRAAHGIELLYVFRTLEDIPFYVPAPGEHAVADQMMDAWLALAATGDPGGGAAGDWPPYVDGSETSLVFDDPPSTEDGLRGAQCDMWIDLIGDLI